MAQDWNSSEASGNTEIDYSFNLAEIEAGMMKVIDSLLEDSSSSRRKVPEVPQMAEEPDYFLVNDCIRDPDSQSFSSRANLIENEPNPEKWNRQPGVIERIRYCLKCSPSCKKGLMTAFYGVLFVWFSFLAYMGITYQNKCISYNTLPTMYLIMGLSGIIAVVSKVFTDMCPSIIFRSSFCRYLTCIGGIVSVVTYIIHGLFIAFSFVTLTQEPVICNQSFSNYFAYLISVTLVLLLFTIALLSPFESGYYQ